MKLCLIFVLTLSLCLTALGQPTTSVHTTGLNTPNKIIKCPENALLVAEAGTHDANTGRISVVDRTSGDRHTLIEGLPSGVSFLGGNPAGDPDGPSGLHLRGNTLFVTIGVGDAVIPGGGPGLELPAPAPSSPIFNSILEIILPGGYPSLKSGFTMTPADQVALNNGEWVTINNDDGQSIDVHVVANLPDYRSEPRPGNPDNVKASHLYGVELWQRKLYVADAGHNNIKSVSLFRGEVEILTTFPPRPNPLFPNVGGPFIEAVPDNLHRFGNVLLVPLLTGFPFIVGGSEVQKVSLRTGDHSVLISGLSSAIDILKSGDEEEESVGEGLAKDDDGLSRPIEGRVLPKLELVPADKTDGELSDSLSKSARVASPLEKGQGPIATNDAFGEGVFGPGDRSSYYTLEFSTNMLQGAPGRLRFYLRPGMAPQELVTDLITPTSMARDPDTGNIYITNIGPGTVTKVSFP